MKNIILIRHPKNWGFEEMMVKRLAHEALSSWGYKQGVELSLWFVGRTKAKELNIKYRSKDYIPQVLGFPLSKSADEDGLTRLGDIVICSQKLKYELRYRREALDVVMLEWLKHGVENLLKTD